MASVSAQEHWSHHFFAMSEFYGKVGQVYLKLKSCNLGLKKGNKKI